MSNNTEENANKNNFEQQFYQLLSKFDANELILKTTKEHLNNSIKHNILLEQELKTEQHSKLVMKMKLDTLTEMNNNRNNNPEFSANVLVSERDYLAKKIYEINVENVGLKQVIKKYKSQILSLLADKNKYSEKMNSMTLIFNSFQEQLKKLNNESHTLVDILSVSVTLSKKILYAFEYSKKLKKYQMDYIKHLIEEITKIKSKVHAIIDEDDKSLMTEANQKTIISFNQAHLDISQKLVEVLKDENDMLHKKINEMIKKPTIEQIL